MVRWLALALLWLVGVAPAIARPSSKYIRYGLPELCFEAESIVVGKIVSLDSRSFEFAISRHLSGAPLPQLVRVQRCAERTYAMRWARYGPDQELLLFLKRETFDQQLRTVGGFCQGELPVLGTDVGLLDFRWHDIASERIELEAGPRYMQRVPLVDLEAVILYVREHFEYVPQTHERRGSIVPHSSLEEIGEFAKSSKIAWHAVNALYSSQFWDGPLPEAGPRLGPDALARIVFPDTKEGTVRRLVSIGDLDKDGFPEALATVFFAPHALALVHTSAAGELRFEPIQVELRPDQNTPGTCVPLGDLEGDGRPDFVLHTGPAGWVLLSLASDGKSARWRELDTLGLLHAAGLGIHTTPTDRMAALGDLDCDGTIELVVQLESRSHPRATAHGSLAVLSINRQGEFVRAKRWEGHEIPLDACGPDLCIVPVGDVDGDGVIDVAWGNCSAEVGWRARGALWIVFLERDGSVRSSRAFSPLTVDVFDRSVHEGRFASSLSAAGDIDGDSIPDLLASSSSGLWTLLLARDGSVRTVRRLLNPAEFEPADAPRRRSQALPMWVGTPLACEPARQGQAPLVYAGTWVRSAERAGVLALSLDPDGTLRLR